MPNDQANNAVHEQRVRASWRTRACAAGWCVGTQVFLAGCAVGMPLAQNGVWIASLAALPFAAWLTVRCRRRLCAQDKPDQLLRVGYGLLAITLLGCGAFAAMSLAGFAAQTLVEQSRTIWTAATALLAVLGCAASGGMGAARLCFALRYVIPALVLGLSLTAVPMRVPIGLFPILGAGAGSLGLAALSMLFGAVPALMLMLPESAQKEGAPNTAVPEQGFFLMRVLMGALVGFALLFLTNACTTYESIAENAAWGARLRMAVGNQPHEGIVEMILILAKLFAMLMLAVNMVCAAQQAWGIAMTNGRGNGLGWLVMALLMTACLALAEVYGDGPVLTIAPLLAVSAAASALILGRRRSG